MASKKKKKADLDLSIFKEAVDKAFNHVLITDPDGKIIYANKAVTKITGYSNKEVIGKTPSLWGQQMDEKFYKDFWKTIKKDKKTFKGQVKNKRKNGEIYYAEVSVKPILDDDKNVKFFVGIERDITSEVKAKEELALFEKIFEESPIGKALVSLEGKFIRVNPQLPEITGYSKKELLKLNFRDITHPDDLAEDLKKMKQLLSGKIDQYEMEKRYIKKNGSYVWTLLTGTLVKDNDEPSYFIAHIVDINDRKIKEREIEAFFETSVDYMCIANKEGKFTKVNKAFMKNLGWSEKELLGKPYLSFVHKDDIEKTKKQMKKIEEGEAIEGFTNRYRLKNGKYKWLSWVATPQEEGSIYAVARDITKEVISKMEQAENLQKMAQINDIMVGREIRMIEMKKKIEFLQKKIKKLQES